MDQIQTVPAIQSASMSQKITGLLEKYPVILQLLRFGCIGVLNTALDFLILNVVSKTLGITEGASLGRINVIGFSLAVIQSYYWNKYWAFGGNMNVTLLKNFVRLVLVGALGTLAMLLVLLGAGITAPPVYYLIILGIFVIGQIVFWNVFAFQKPEASQNYHQFVAFLIVSVIGLLINSGLIAVLTSAVEFTDNDDLNKNIAKIVATLASLVWNFIGYKIFVFKK
jgi:putative flippase GtrA